MKKTLLVTILLTFFITSTAFATDIRVEWPDPLNSSITNWTLKFGAVTGGPYTAETALDIPIASASLAGGIYSITITNFTTTYPDEEYYIVYSATSDSGEGPNSQEVHYIKPTLMKDSHTTLTTPGTTNMFAIAGRTYSAFNFTASSSYTLTNLRITLHKYGLPTGPITVYIYADSAGKPSGAPLGVAQTIDISTFDTAASIQLVWNFTGVSITSGSKYHVVLHKDACYTDAYAVLTIGTKAGHNILYAPESGTYTQLLADKQASFETYALTQTTSTTTTAVGTSTSSSSTTTITVTYFGNNVSGAYTDTEEAGYANFNVPYTYSGTGSKALYSLQYLTAYSAGGTLRLAIYDSSGNFIAQGKTYAVTTGSLAWIGHTTFTNRAGTDITPTITGGSTYTIVVSMGTADTGRFSGHGASGSFKYVLGNYTSAEFPATLTALGTPDEWDISLCVRAGVVNIVTTTTSSIPTTTTSSIPTTTTIDPEVTTTIPTTTTTALIEITEPAITGITRPVSGQAVDTSADVPTHGQYTVSPIAWYEILGPFWFSITGHFEPNKIYTAYFNVTPTATYTLTGVDENFFTVIDATCINDENDGYIVATFPVTTPIDKTVVSEFNIAGITAPVKFVEVDSTGTNGTQWTITSIVWYPTTALAHSQSPVTTFDAGTEYAAEITLTVTGDYTFTGIPAATNRFSVSGSPTSGVNYLGSGDTIVIYAVYPATVIRPVAPTPTVTAVSSARTLRSGTYAVGGGQPSRFQVKVGAGDWADTTMVGTTGVSDVYMDFPLAGYSGAKSFQFRACDDADDDHCSTAVTTFTTNRCQCEGATQP